MSERRSGSVRRMLRPAGEDDRTGAGRHSAFGGGSFDEVEASIGQGRKEDAAVVEPEAPGEGGGRAADLPHDRPRATAGATVGATVGATSEASAEPTEAERARARARQRQEATAVAKTPGRPSGPAARGQARHQDALAALGAVVAAGEIPTARKGYHLPEAVVWALEDLRTHFQRVERFTAREASHSNIVAAALMRYHEETLGRDVDL